MNNLKTNHIHEKQNITKSDRNVLMPKNVRIN